MPLSTGESLIVDRQTPTLVAMVNIIPQNHTVCYASQVARDLCPSTAASYLNTRRCSGTSSEISSTKLRHSSGFFLPPGCVGLWHRSTDQ